MAGTLTLTATRAPHVFMMWAPEERKGKWQWERIEIKARCNVKTLFDSIKEEDQFRVRATCLFEVWQLVQVRAKTVTLHHSKQKGSW